MKNLDLKKSFLDVSETFKNILIFRFFSFLHGLHRNNQKRDFSTSTNTKGKEEKKILHAFHFNFCETRKKSFFRMQAHMHTYRMRDACPNYSIIKISTA